MDVDWYVEADQPKTRFVIDKEKAALHGISAETISQTLRIAVGGESIDLLHVPSEKEDVDLVLQLPLASRTSPGGVAGVAGAFRGRQRAAGTGSGGGWPPLVPLRELVTVEHTIADKSIYHKNLMPVTYVIGDVAGVVESPVYAILEMNRALKKLDAGALMKGSRTSRRRRGAARQGVQIYNAVQPFTDNDPGDEMGWRMAHHDRGVPRPRDWRSPRCWS